MGMTRCDLNASIRRFKNHEDLTEIAVEAMINAFNSTDMRAESSRIVDRFEEVIDVMRERLT